MAQVLVALYSISAGSPQDRPGFLSQTNGSSISLLLISSYSSTLSITLHFKQFSHCAACVSIGFDAEGGFCQKNKIDVGKFPS